MTQLTEEILRPIVESLFRVCTDSTIHWLLGGQAEIAPVIDGRSVAHYCRRIAIGIAICAGLFLILTLCCLTSAGGLKWFALLTSTLTLLSIWTLLDCVYFRIEFNRDELIIQQLGKGRRIIPWSAVRSLDFSIWSYRNINTDSCGSIKVSQYLSGSQSLIDLTNAILKEKKIPTTIGRQKIRPFFPR